MEGFNKIITRYMSAMPEVIPGSVQGDKLRRDPGVFLFGTGFFSLFCLREIKQFFLLFDTFLFVFA